MKTYALDTDTAILKVEASGPVLTGSEGAPIPLTADQLGIVAYFEGGLLFVNKNRQFTPESHNIYPYLTLLKKPVNETVLVSAEVINFIYRKGTSNKLLKDATSAIKVEIATVLADAARAGATDIHIRHDEHTGKIWFRVDSQIFHYKEESGSRCHFMLSTLFAAADQSGVAYNRTAFQKARVSDTGILPEGIDSLRLQYNPCLGGRHLAIRVLSNSNNFQKEKDYSLITVIETDRELPDMGELGFTERQQKMLDRMSLLPAGMILNSGPTSSGKSTTLNRLLLREMIKNQFKRLCVMIEDPSEIEVEEAIQFAISADTKAEQIEKYEMAMVALLRSDPDTFVFGEINDSLTAKTAVDAATTGHKGLSTIHATRLSIIYERLLDLGIHESIVYDPDIIAGLIYQRKVAVLCEECKTSAFNAHRNGKLDEELWERLIKVGLDEEAFVSSGGCDRCAGGTAGETIIAEILAPDRRFCGMMKEGKHAKAFKYWETELSGEPLMDVAIEKIRAGIISPAEAERVIGILNLDGEASYEDD